MPRESLALGEQGQPGSTQQLHSLRVPQGNFLGSLPSSTKKEVNKQGERGESSVTWQFWGQLLAANQGCAAHLATSVHLHHLGEPVELPEIGQGSPKSYRLASDCLAADCHGRHGECFHRSQLVRLPTNCRK